MTILLCFFFDKFYELAKIATEIIVLVDLPTSPLTVTFSPSYFFPLWGGLTLWGPIPNLT